MEQDFVLELFLMGNIYQLPANIQVSNDGFLFQFSLPTVDVVFKKREDGSYRPLYLNHDHQKNIRDIDRQLVKVISSHIEEILA